MKHTLANESAIASLRSASARSSCLGSKFGFADWLPLPPVEDLSSEGPIVQSSHRAWRQSRRVDPRRSAAELTRLYFDFIRNAGAQETRPRAVGVLSRSR